MRAFLVSTFLGKEDKKYERNILLWTTLNGWSMFALSYFSVYLISQLAAVLLAKYGFGIDVYLHFNGLEFKLNGKTWDTSNVVPVFLASPVVAFSLAAISLKYLIKLELNGTLWKQFFFWCILHGVNLSVGSIVSGVIAYDGIWFALRWLSIPESGIILVAGLAILVLLGIGYFSTTLLFMCCDSLTLMKEANRIDLLKGMLLYPWVLGTLFLALLKYPFSHYDFGLFGSMLLLLLPIYSKGKRMLVNDRVNSPRRTYAAWEVVIFVVLITVIMKFLL